MDIYFYDLLVVFTAVAATTWWSKVLPLHIFYARKVLHILAISACAHAVSITNSETYQPFIFLLTAFSILLFWAVWKGFFQTEGRRSWGIAYFPMVLLALEIVYPTEQRLISLAFYILAFGDGLSAIFGRLFHVSLGSLIFPRHKLQSWNSIHWGRDHKTLMGSSVFTLAAGVILYIYFPEIQIVDLFLIALSIAAIEVISSSGTDNLTVPLWVFFAVPVLSDFQVEPLFLLVGVLMSVFLFRFKWLSLSGIVFASILCILFLASNAPLYLLFVFLIIGSLASKLNRKKVAEAADSKSSKPRDVWQVIANGGIAVVILLVFGGHPEFRNILIYVSIAVALADTLSSELGVFFGGRTYSIIGFRMVSPGLSGGISFMGTLSGLLGSGFIGLLSIWMESYSWENALFISLFGFSGMLLDSFIGELFQAKYQNHDGSYSDQGIELVKGIRGFTNDTTNWVSNAITVILSAILVIAL
jgi:uncharacterized protein (TIGR00297 family)